MLREIRNEVCGCFWKKIALKGSQRNVFLVYDLMVIILRYISASNHRIVRLKLAHCSMSIIKKNKQANKKQNKIHLKLSNVHIKTCDRSMERQEAGRWTQRWKAANKNSSAQIKIYVKLCKHCKRPDSLKDAYVQFTDL